MNIFVDAMAPQELDTPRSHSADTLNTYIMYRSTTGNMLTAGNLQAMKQVLLQHLRARDARKKMHYGPLRLIRSHG